MTDPQQKSELQGTVDGSLENGRAHDRDALRYGKKVLALLPDDQWFPLAVARTRVTMRWATSLSLLGVGLAIWLERGAAIGLAALALLLGLVGLALHQSVARAGS